MFKKIYEKIDSLYQFTKACFDAQAKSCCNTNALINKLSSECESKLNKMSKTITSQQRTIEQLTNALKDKYEHGLFVFSEDCKVPMVIRNGKEITDELTSCFKIEWQYGEAPNIEIEQLAGTSNDLED